MSKTTIKQELINTLKIANTLYESKPLAIYVKDLITESVYMWSGETTLEHFLSTFKEETPTYCLGFTGVVWFDNGDYAESAYENLETDNVVWDYHHLPKLEDYFNVVTK